MMEEPFPPFQDGALELKLKLWVCIPSHKNIPEVPGMGSTSVTSHLTAWQLGFYKIWSANNAGSTEPDMVL